MKPWVFTDKNKMSSFRSGTNSTSIGVLALGLCRPCGAQKNVYQCLTQGLRPGLGRSIALTGLVSVSASLKLELGRGEYCVDTALLCNGLVFSLGLKA